MFVVLEELEFGAGRSSRADAIALTSVVTWAFFCCDSKMPFIWLSRLCRRASQYAISASGLRLEQVGTDAGLTSTGAAADVAELSDVSEG